jgi:hypothetical protein
MESSRAFPATGRIGLCASLIRLSGPLSTSGARTTRAGIGFGDGRWNVANTLGGGNGTSGATEQLIRDVKRGGMSAEGLDACVKYANGILADPEANKSNIGWASKLLTVLNEQSQRAALKLAEYERIDAGKNTTAEKITVRITFDDAG